MICVFPTDITQMSGEKLLIKHLLENYETIGIVGRPVYNTSETISVQYGIGLIQILDLNEKDQILTTNVWCRYVSYTMDIEDCPALLPDVTGTPHHPAQILGFLLYVIFLLFVESNETCQSPVDVPLRRNSNPVFRTRRRNSTNLPPCPK